MSGTPPYVELHAHSAYSFLDGTSHPHELIERATELGHATLALKMGEVFAPMAAAGVVYLGLTLWLKVPAAKDVIGLVKARVT